MVISPEFTQSGIQEYMFNEEQFKEVQEFEVEISLPAPETPEPALGQQNPYVLGIDDVIKIEVIFASPDRMLVNTANFDIVTVYERIGD